MKTTQLLPEFVKHLPDHLKDGVLYISMEHTVASHKCACGCGRETVTPLSPTDWQLYFNGRAVSLEPSIGNWNFPCRSHYWVEGGSVRWASEMSARAIEQGRARSRAAKQRHYAPNGEALPGIEQRNSPATCLAQTLPVPKRRAWLSALARWMNR